jgi:predicted PurR-regulated permease PerM
MGSQKLKGPTLKNQHAPTTFFLLAMAVAAAYLCYLIARPYVGPILLAAMIAIIAYPLHLRIRRRLRRPNAAALVSTLLILVLVIIPSIGLVLAVREELPGVYRFVSEKSSDGQGSNALHKVLGWLGRYVDLSKFDLQGALQNSVERVSQPILSWGAKAVGNTISFIVSFFVAFFTLFFLFRDGGRLKTAAGEWLPLRKEQIERLFDGVSNSIVANIYGSLAAGLAQGSLVTLAFVVLGLPSPILAGIVTAIFSLVPLIGSAAVWVPAAVFLMIGGQWWKAIILLAFGVVVIAQVDNFLRPYVIGQRAKLHTLLVFFAVLGGIEAFGVLGLFIGPIVLAITPVIFEMLREAQADSPVAVPVHEE